MDDKDKWRQEMEEKLQSLGRAGKVLAEMGERYIAEMKMAAELPRVDEELPDLPNAELLAEAQTLLASCRPLHRTPSSARMRRVLRALVKLLEEKQKARRHKRQRDSED